MTHLLVNFRQNQRPTETTYLLPAGEAILNRINDDSAGGFYTEAVLNMHNKCRWGGEICTQQQYSTESIDVSAGAFCT
jgi:hypothetical protein